MKIPPRTRIILTLAAALAAGAASAQQTWDYTGAMLTDTVGYGAPELATYLSGDIVLAQTLAPNEADQVVTPVSFAFTDGTAGLQPDSYMLASNYIEPQQTSFEFSTQNGAITAWNVVINANTGYGSTATQSVFMQLTTSGDTWGSIINTPACEDPNMVSVSCSGASGVSAVGGSWVPAAPELDWSRAIAALTLLAGLVVVIKARGRELEWQ